MTTSSPRSAGNVASKDAAGWTRLGSELLAGGRVQDALGALVRAVASRSDFAPAWKVLGGVLHDSGERAGASACFELARSVAPQPPDRCHDEDFAHSRLPPATVARLLAALGTSLVHTGPFEPAIALFERSLQLGPDFAPAHANFGALLLQASRLDDGIARLRSALQLQPNDAASRLNLGNGLIRSAQHAEAIEQYRQAIALKPGDPNFHSHLVGNLHYVPGIDARSLLVEAREWERLHARPDATPIAPHLNDRRPDRRLRVGYVSPDFRSHPQRFFMLPVLAHHDRESFEIFCYSNVRVPDDVTARVRSLAHQWRDIAAMDDTTAAERVREDRIDILVDLAMHTENNRLPLFALKPAPVQVCWLAYPGTTGLTAMDYRLTDGCFDPPEADAAAYSERSVRLPGPYWCYDPLSVGPPVGPLPARAAGLVRFGSLNNFCKISDPLLGLWASVLRGVPGARMLLFAPPGEARRRVLTTFAGHGVDAERIEFTDRRPHAEYFALYGDIDIALDTSPFCGGTTSLEAFWMGVPVVTLVGETVVGRGGLSLATNLGLPQLVARTPDSYVAIAIELARDLDGLAALRSGLRARLERSPLMDAPAFVRGLEAAFRQMWRRWSEA